MTRIDQPVLFGCMRLFGKWRILVEGDERVLSVFPWQRKGFDYLLTRLFEGNDVAADAFEHYGVTVRHLAENDEIMTVPPPEPKD